MTGMFPRTEPADITRPVSKPDQYSNTKLEQMKKSCRVPLHLVCPAGIVHEAQAMRNGFIKYGYASFLNDDVPMSALDCLGAAMRHIERLKNGEDLAPDSKAHHAGHARAMLGIYLECMEAGKLIDDRHKKRGYIGPLLDKLAEQNTAEMKQG